MFAKVIENGRRLQSSWRRLGNQGIDVHDGPEDEEWQVVDYEAATTVGELNCAKGTNRQW